MTVAMVMVLAATVTLAMAVPVAMPMILAMIRWLPGRGCLRRLIRQFPQ
jgi:hypothetical protein